MGFSATLPNTIRQTFCRIIEKMLRPRKYSENERSKYNQTSGFYRERCFLSFLFGRWGFRSMGHLVCRVSVFVCPGGRVFFCLVGFCLWSGIFLVPRRSGGGHLQRQRRFRTSHNVCPAPEILWHKWSVLYLFPSVSARAICGESLRSLVCSITSSVQHVYYRNFVLGSLSVV